jgi:hypothetical protein
VSVGIAAHGSGAWSALVVLLVSEGMADDVGGVVDAGAGRLVVDVAVDVSVGVAEVLEVVDAVGHAGGVGVVGATVLVVLVVLVLVDELVEDELVVDGRGVGLEVLVDVMVEMAVVGGVAADVVVVVDWAAVVLVDGLAQVEVDEARARGRARTAGRDGGPTTGVGDDGRVTTNRGRPPAGDTVLIRRSTSARYTAEWL